ncbi:MAG TPA: tetratricopeptide repeat protein [Nevskiaceae bacterium]|nr:tetratricopeptide repeat protein [Nevskiaceae bacterium]
MVDNRLNNIITWLIVGLIFLTPLFFLPITTNFYGFNKNFLLYLATAILVLAWGLRIALTKKIQISRTPFGLLIILFAFGQIMATLFASPNKTETLLLAGETGTIIVLGLLYFLLVNNLKPNTKRYCQNAIITSAALLGLLAVFQFLGLTETLLATNAPSWLKLKLWTPTGGPLILVSFLLIGLVLSLITFLKKFTQSTLKAVGFGLATVLCSLGLIVTVSQILPGKESAVTILPYSSTWAIAIEAFKQNPLFGVGPANFASAFNRFRPIAFNQNEFWNARFGVSSSYPLHLLATSGLFGLVPFVLLTLKILRQAKKNKSNLLYLGLLACLLLLFFLPGSFLILFTFFVLLAIWAPKSGEPLGTSPRDESVLPVPKQLSLIPLGLVGVAVAVAFYFGGRAYMADVYFRRSLTALAQNQGIETYNYQIKALELNPRQTSYRLAYSQTNFALANSLASQPDLSDQGRAQISQLIQQAINEAKLATVLSPNNAETWENLGQLYRNIINFAQGAEEWAIATCRQAVVTDPINPRLRVDLGGLYYSLQNYDAAVRQFQIAVDLKPDFANGYYNLAAAYREQEKYPEAHQAMQLVLNFIPFDSADYQKAKDELDELAKKLPVEATPAPQPTPKPEEELTKPEPLPSPIIEPPIELPEEAGPEVTPIPQQP